MNDNARLLIVNAGAPEAARIEAILTGRGDELFAVEGADEAIRRLTEERFDVVILAARSGEVRYLELLDGFESLGLTASVPFMVVGVPDEVHQRVQALQRGAADVVGAPSADGAELCARLDHLVRTKRDREALRGAIERQRGEVAALENALLDAQRMEVVGNLAGGVAHDFNNLLTAIISFAEFVRVELDEGDPRRADLDEVLDAAARASELTAQLLAFSRNRPSTVRPFDLNERVVKTSKLLRRIVGPQVEVTVTSSAQPAVVHMDPVQLDQVLLNLAANARDAMPDGGRLHVVVREPSDSTVGIEISDSGSPREPAAVFGKRPRRLGLAICESILEGVRGSMSAEARPEGGTRVRVELALGDEGLIEQESEPRDDLAGAGETVLVAEDEAALRVVAQRTLEEAGYEVLLARDGAEAVSLLEQKGATVDLVFSDVVMPKRSGSSVIDATREHAPQAAVLVTSGYIDEAGPLGRTLIEDRPILWKPYTPQMLLQAVRRALVRRGAGVASGTRATSAAPASANDIAFSAGLGAESTSAEAAGTDVLVLDDSGDSALTAALSAGGYTIVRARSTGELRRALETQPYLAFAFDAGRHDGQLAKILSIVRTVHPNLPVVVTSEVASGELVRAVSHYHGVEYLGRPYTPAEMTEAVENALKTGRVAVLQSKLLAARAGADVFLDDLEATEQAFEQALDSLFMVYQPIVRSRDHSIFGYEALLRCNVPALPNPPAVLTAAEVLGRVVDLGRVVRRKVRDDIDALEDGISVFVNLHPLELREKYLASSSEPLMSATRRIVLEVTERASLSGGPQLLEEVRRLRGHGYRIAVDDLGEGYAGLSSLAHLTPDIVKIDRSLVERIETSPLKEDIVASIVLMARKAGITTVAEGIETVEERDVLTMLGCDLLQGYYFARPGLPFPPVITT